MNPCWDCLLTNLPMSLIPQLCFLTLQLIKWCKEWGALWRKFAQPEVTLYREGVFYYHNVYVLQQGLGETYIVN